MSTHTIERHPVHQDFVCHLQSRLGLTDEAAAMSTLGDWIASYQPGPLALAQATSLSKLCRIAA